MVKVILLLIAINANASPYFRPLDVSHPQPILGALLDPKDLGRTEASSLLPLITHSPKDGCIIPNLCEEWSPLAVGASINAGNITFDIAPLINVLPWAQAGALAIIPQSFVGLRSVLSSQQSSRTFSAGPVWEYSQRTNHGYFKMFTGLALSF
jgi:hypothetical protein